MQPKNQKRNKRPTPAAQKPAAARGGSTRSRAAIAPAPQLRARNGRSPPGRSAGRNASRGASRGLRGRRADPGAAGARGRGAARGRARREPTRAQSVAGRGGTGCRTGEPWRPWPGAGVGGVMQNRGQEAAQGELARFLGTKAGGRQRRQLLAVSTRGRGGPDADPGPRVHGLGRKVGGPPRAARRLKGGL